MIRLIFVAAFFSCHMGAAQDVQVIKLSDLQGLMSESSDRVQIINFWATWCAPCIQELPLFEKINASGRRDVKVRLVSMDLDLDPNPEKVYKFIARKKLRSQVLLLDEPEPNAWIDKVDKRWSGALPATIILNNTTGKRIFIGRSLREGELERYLDEIQ